jgi:hypothetical protein
LEYDAFSQHAIASVCTEFELNPRSLQTPDLLNCFDYIATKLTGKVIFLYCGCRLGDHSSRVIFLLFLLGGLILLSNAASVIALSIRREPILHIPLYSGFNASLQAIHGFLAEQDLHQSLFDHFLGLLESIARRATTDFRHPFADLILTPPSLHLSLGPCLSE